MQGPAQLLACTRLQIQQGWQLSQARSFSFPGPQCRGRLVTRWPHLGWGCKPRQRVWGIPQVWLYPWPAAAFDQAPGTKNVTSPLPQLPHCLPRLSASFPILPSHPASLPAVSSSAPSCFKENSYRSQGDGQTLRPSLAHSHPDSHPGQGGTPQEDGASPVHSWRSC